MFTKLEGGGVNKSNKKHNESVIEELIKPCNQLIYAKCVKPNSMN